MIVLQVCLQVAREDTEMRSRYKRSNHELQGKKMVGRPKRNVDGTVDVEC